MIPRPLALAIVVLVSLIWAGNWALVVASSVGVIPSGYQSDVSLNGIFMVVVGGALIASRRRADPDGDDGTDLPDGVAPPPGLDQARRFAAEVLDPQIRARAQEQQPRNRHHRRDGGST